MLECVFTFLLTLVFTVVTCRKHDLCQLVKDMVSVSEETDWNVRASVESKYRALRCHVSVVDSGSEMYDDVMNIIAAQNHG